MKIFSLKFNIENLIYRIYMSIAITTIMTIPFIGIANTPYPEFLKYIVSTIFIICLSIAWKLQDKENKAIHNGRLPY